MSKYNPKTLDDIAISLEDSVDEHRSELIMPIAALEREGKLTKVDEEAILRLAIRIVDKRRFARLLNIPPEEYSPEKILEIIRDAEENERRRRLKR